MKHLLLLMVLPVCLWAQTRTEPTLISKHKVVPTDSIKIDYSPAKLNGGFELVSGNDFTNWTESASGVRDTGAADGGSHAAIMHNTDAGAITLSQNVLTVGKYYNFYIRMRTADYSPANFDPVINFGTNSFGPGAVGTSWTSKALYNVECVGTTTFQIWHNDSHRTGIVDQVRVVETPATAPFVATGSYTGDGTYGKAITNVGFQPDVVLIKSDGAAEAVIRTSSMTGDSTQYTNSKLFNGDSLITELNSTGFKVGTLPETNTGSTTYYWTAFKQNPGYCKVGSYWGNGTDDRSITGVGFQPNLLIILPNSDNVNTGASWKTSSIGGDSIFNFAAYGGFAGMDNTIQAFEADGFQVGTAWQSNASGIHYYYIAFKTQPGYQWTGSYIGDGTTNRSITGLTTAQPDIVWVAGVGVNEARAQRMSSYDADEGGFFNTNVTSGSAVTGFISTGIKVWSSDAVNGNGTTYHYFAWKNH